MSECLEEIIKQYVKTSQPSSSGWCAVRCAVCNDHTRKGLRGAFLFKDDTVIYKCWNCSAKGGYEPTKTAIMSKNMESILNAFGIPSAAWKDLILDNIRKLGSIVPSSPRTLPKQKNIEPIELKQPDIFYRLSDAPPDDQLAITATRYLIDERGIQPEDYPFLLAHNSTNVLLKKWGRRLIIPIFKDNKLIFYTGRALYDAPKKYETPSTEKNRILYGFDLLFAHTTAPLLIVEGWFDAMSIDGIATFGNIITEAQAQWLNKSSREKIYIPDKTGDGHLAAQQALSLGWKISTPNIGSNCKDMNDAVMKYGKLYTIKSIIDNAKAGIAAECAIKLYCK